MDPSLLVGRLKLTRPLVFMDCETTTPADGDDPDPKVDRIVKLAVLKVYPDSKVTQFETLVNPGIPIVMSTTEVHGITDAMVAESPTFGKIGRAVAAGITDCDVCGYNVRRYDVRLFTAECVRHDVVFNNATIGVIDPYLLWARMEPRDLAAWVERFLGVPHTGHHDAVRDVAAVVAGLPAMLDAFPLLPSTATELAALCAPNSDKSANYIDPEGKFQWRDGVPMICFGKNDGQPMHAADRGFYGWILRKSFSPEVQRLARNAQQGVFPTRDTLPLTPDPNDERSVFTDPPGGD